MQTRKVHSNTNRILFSVRTGNVQNVDSYVSESQSILANLFGEAGKTHSVHDMRLNSALERFSEAKLMLQFLRSGRLSTLSEMSPCGDEEYIGAVLGFAQELSRYALGRAAEGDVISVALCQRLVVQLNGKMLEFAFRNGHLRRKFDYLKYSLRAIENSLCELNFVEPLQEIVREQTRPKRKRVDESLSVIGTDDVSVAVHLESIPSGQITDIAISTTIASDSMIEEEPYDILIDTEGFDAIRTRLEAADAIREEAIKLSRDAQKWSKQAIFAVQRAAYTEASTKLKSAESVLLKIQTLIESVSSRIYGFICLTTYCCINIL